MWKEFYVDLSMHERKRETKTRRPDGLLLDCLLDSQEFPTFFVPLYPLGILTGSHVSLEIKDQKVINFIDFILSYYEISK